MTLLMVSLFIFLILGIPIGICLGASSLLYLQFCTDYPMTFLGQNFLFYLHKYTLLTIPFFITAGFMMSELGLIRRLLDFAHELLKWVWGGVGAATMATCVAFAAMTGSSVAEATAMAIIAIPEMKKRGYSDSLSAGIVSMGGTLGILIPPSLTLILYGLITDVSIIKLFMAGVIPGIMLGSLLILEIIIIAKKQKIPRVPFHFNQEQFKRLGKTFMAAVPALLMPVIVLGGLYGGVFAPTEAGAAACGYALIYGLIEKRAEFLKALPKIFATSLRLTTMVFLLLGGVGLFNGVLANEYIPQKLTGLIVGLGLSPTSFLLIYMGTLLIMGCFVDAMGMIGLTVPLVFPICLAMGINPIALGILITVNCELGAITPPVGITLLAVSGVSKIPVSRVLRGVAPFFLMVLAFLIFLVFTPGVSTWLPDIMTPEIIWGG